MAADKTITFQSYAYTASDVTIKVSDAATFSGTFMSHPLIWDHGEFGDTRTGASQQFAFSQPGTYSDHCELHVDPPRNMKGVIRVVANQHPANAFGVSPAQRVGRPVTFTYTGADPDGTLTGWQWDLDGDGPFKTTTPAGTATRTFTTPTTVTVRMRAIDDSGEPSATAEQAVTIAAARSGGSGSGSSGGSGSGASDGKDTTAPLATRVKLPGLKLSFRSSSARSRRAPCTLRVVEHIESVGEFAELGGGLPSRAAASMRASPGHESQKPEPSPPNNPSHASGRLRPTALGAPSDPPSPSCKRGIVMSTDRITCEIARSAPTQRRPCPPVSRRNDVTALVHGAAAGEERAWALLVGRFDATIHAVARRHRLSVADQDDVAQTTWLKLVVHVKQLKHRAALGGWLTTTAQRECLRVLEAAQRELPVNEPIVADRPDGTSVEDEAAAGERRDALHRALEGAPAHERMLVRLLLDAPALSYDDVSAALGIPKGTIGPTRGRCIARLRNDRHLAGVVGSHATPRATGRRPTPGHDLS